MQKYVHAFRLLSTVLTISALSTVTVAAMPLEARAHAHVAAETSASSTEAGANTDTTMSDGTMGPNDKMKMNNSDAKATAEQRMAAAKLKRCENRQRVVTNIMTRIADRGQKQVTLFGTIATRVETFYTAKGKTLSNYSTLVADVNTKQAAAQKAVDTIKANSTSFNCDNTDNKGVVTAFQGSLKSEISALKDYRTSVKNLIVGVKSVQSTSTTTSTTNTTTTTESTGSNQ